MCGQYVVDRVNVWSICGRLGKCVVNMWYSSSSRLYNSDLWYLINRRYKLNRNTNSEKDTLRGRTVFGSFTLYSY